MATLADLKSIKEKETGKNCDLNLVFDVEQMEKLTIQATQCAASDYNGLNTEMLKDLGEKIVELAERIENRK